MQHHSQLAEIQRPLKHVNTKRTFALKMVISPRCDEKQDFVNRNESWSDTGLSLENEPREIPLTQSFFNVGVRC